MKKLFLGLLLVGLLGGLGLAAWTSWAAQARHRALVNALVRFEDVRLLASEYSSGWLSSRAETSVELHGPVGRAYAERLSEAGVPDVRARVGVRVRHTIEHGPLAFWRWLREGAIGAPVVARVATRIELDNETESELDPVLGRLPPLELATTVRVTGRAEGVLRVAPGRLVWRHVPAEPEEEVESEEERERAREAALAALPAPLHIDWRGLAATLLVTEPGGRSGRVSARIELPGLALAREGRATRARDLHAELELHGLEAGAPQLRWSARLGALELARVRRPEAEVEAPASEAGEDRAREGHGEAASEAAEPRRPEEDAAEPPVETAVPAEEAPAEGEGSGAAEPRPRLLAEGWVASGRLELGRPLSGTLETEVASLRTPGASLGPARAALVLQAARPGAGPVAEAQLRRLTLDTPEGEIRGEGRLHLRPAAEGEDGASGLAARLGGEIALGAPARVADWLRVRSPELRRLLEAHAAPAAGGDRVRARLRLEAGGLRSGEAKTALRD